MSRHQLQKRARRNIRRHSIRALVRFVVLASVDAVCVIAATVVVALIFDFERLLFEVGPVPPTGIILGLLLTGNYARGDKRLSMGRLLAGLVAGLLIMRGESLLAGAPAELGPAGVWFVAVYAALVGGRILVDQALKRLRLHTAHAATSLVVGPPVSNHPLFRLRMFDGSGSYRLVGAVLPPEAVAHPSLPVLGTYDDLDRVIDEHGVESVFVTGPVSDRDFSRIVDVTLATGCELLSYARTLRVGGVQPRLRWSDREPIIELLQPGIKGRQLLSKRILDLVVAAVAIVILSPVMLLIAGLIKATSPGPVLFRQTRVGLGGNEFSIMKFRTMTVGAEEQKEGLKSQSVYDDGRLFKIPNDPRVTPLGRFLRRSSLDELPQFFNVLMGEMSLVGPRPPVPAEVALYEEHHFARFDVKPGITGPWQVGGRNRITDFEEIVRLEREYIRNWSPVRDLKILLKTVPVVLRGDGAH